MFDRLAGKLQTAVLVGLVSLISLIFVLQFGGPQAQGCTSGGSTYIARVRGTRLQLGDFRSAAALMRMDRVPAELRRELGLDQLLVDALVERELFAAEARKVGFEVTEDMVMQRLAKRGEALMSAASTAPPYLGLRNGPVPVPVRDAEGNFDIEAAKRQIQFGQQRSIKEFSREQIAETLALNMRELVRQSAAVTPSEVRARYAMESETRTVTYALFQPRELEDLIPVSDADVAAFLVSDAERVATTYTAQRERFQDLPRQVNYRQIMVSADSTQPERQAVAAATIEDILAKLGKGESFAALARRHSEDLASGRRGGEVGFRALDALPAALKAAVEGAEPGARLGPLAVDDAIYIVEVKGFREGDVSEEAAKLDIAERLVRQQRAEALVEQLATATQDALKEGALEAEWLEAQLKQVLQLSDIGGLSDLPALKTTAAFTRGERPLKLQLDEGSVIKAIFALDETTPAPETPIVSGKARIALRIKEAPSADFDQLSPEAQTEFRQKVQEEREDRAVRVAAAVLRHEAEKDRALNLKLDALRAE